MLCLMWVVIVVALVVTVLGTACTWTRPPTCSATLEDGPLRQALGANG